MKKIFLALFMCVVSVAMYADGEVVYDGIYYSVGGDTATVLQQSNYWTPEGDIVIPEEIKDESGRTYTVTELGYRAFFNTNIGTITIPGTIRMWGEDCVNSCRSLTKVTFGNDITSIGFCAFNQCYLLETINLAYTKVERIEQQGFSLCSGLTTILLPSTLKYLSHWVFMSCLNVESLTCMAETPPECSENNPFMNFPTSTCTLYVPIGCADAYRAAPCWEAFEHIEEIEGIEDIPLANGDIIDVDGIYYKIVSIKDFTVEVTWGSTSPSAGTETYVGELTIPSTVTYEGISFNVIGIGESAFRGNSELTAVSLPDAVTYINAYAFEDCVGLTSMELPSGIDELKDGLFEGCIALESVEIPSSVTTIGNRAFYGCSGLTTIDIPTEVESIGSYTFYGCTSLAELTLPSELTSISDYTFYGCRALTGINIPSNVTSLGNYAFACCDGLIEITIPDNVTSIGSYLLYNCQTLEKVTIGSGLTATSTHMFDSCPTLTEVELSNNITTLTDNTFKSCTGLTALTIPSSITTIEEYVFSRCSNLTSVEIPESVTSIGMYSFAMCSSLEDITIPKSITTVTERLFSWCEGMTQATLPETLTSIEANAFDGCTGLEQITSLNPEPPTCGAGVFNDVDKENCMLMVPEGTVDTYANADTWKEFKYISDGITTTSIASVHATEQATISGYYTVDGRALSAPQKGINIIRYSDGSVKKIYVK